MLPDEVLRDIVLPAIARNPEARQLLETLEITSRRLNALATSIFDGDYRIRGLRVVTRMRVYSTGEVIFLTGTFSAVHQSAVVNLSREVRLALQIRHLRLPFLRFATLERAKSGIPRNVQRGSSRSHHSDGWQASVGELSMRNTTLHNTQFTLSRAVIL